MPGTQSVLSEGGHCNCSLHFRKVLVSQQRYCNRVYVEGILLQSSKGKRDTLHYCPPLLFSKQSAELPPGWPWEVHVIVLITRNLYLFFIILVQQ